MESSLLIAVLGGLGGMFGWGISDFFAKKSIDKIGELKTLFWAQVFGILPLTFIFLYNPIQPAVINNRDLLLITSIAVLDILSWLFIYRGFKKGIVSILSPIFSTFSIIVLLFSVTFFNEVLNDFQIATIIAVFVGVFLLSFNTQQIRKALKTGSISLASGVSNAIGASISYAAFLLLLDYVISGRPWAFILIIIRILVISILYIGAKGFHHSLVVKQWKLWPWLMVIGCFDVMAYALVSYGYSSTTYTGLITVLVGAFPLPTIVLARIFLKEKLNPLQILCVFVILGGIALIALS